ncbi:hypothetical protein ABZS77_06735 [Micromonospora sp. NPDC005298]|uniref:hypothetical protein n=1 Tax=Micromonospora sp. NPDC005298 TaxID=3156873 RepID=UPI0033AD692D
MPDNLVVAGSDFEDLTLTGLRLSTERREVVLATRWLDDDHRHLLSLWWLVEAGHLCRADLVDALQLDPHHVTVRVARMKAQLDTARLVVRARSARPGCAGLIDTASDWDGQPAQVWRKRLARRIRTCAQCPNATSDLVPAERLLAGLALTPLPAGLASDVSQEAHTVSGGVAGRRADRRVREDRRGVASGRRRGTVSAQDPGRRLRGRRRALGLPEVALGSVARIRRTVAFSPLVSGGRPS